MGVGPSSAGVWIAHTLRDSHGRAIRAERPQLKVDADARAVVVFRGLGFGPTVGGQHVALPADPVGINTGAGELVQLEVTFDSVARDPVYLTADGGGYFRPAAVFDPASDGTIAVAVPWLTTVTSQRRSESLLGASTRLMLVAEGDPVVFAVAPRQPDFEAVTMTLSARYPLPGAPIAAQVTVRNDGVTWQGSPTDTLNILATWDGGPGVGAPAGIGHLTVLDAGTRATVTLGLTPPVTLDAAHTLLVTINPTQTVPEGDDTNNSRTGVVGGLPAPSGVRAAAEVGNPLVFLQWPAMDDPRVSGYRIYRAADQGSPVPVGSTFVTGFVDLTAVLDRTYHYTVTSVVSIGVESGPSNVVDVTLNSWHLYLPLAVRKWGT